MAEIDLNADLGEGFGPWQMGDDKALLGLLSSANIACGFHAGDPAIMDRTVREALDRGVDVGAHVGFPDRQGFGRRVMQIEPAELTSIVVYQLGALAGIAHRAGHRTTHMSFHGALGNLAAADAALADILVRAVAEFDRGLTILSSTSRAIEDAASRHGLRVATSFLADRAYDDHGLLVPRKLPNSIVKDPKTCVERVTHLLQDGTVTTYSGKRLAMRAASILLHSDTQGALALAGEIRAAVERSGAQVVPLSHQKRAAI
jgi:5-oxoprolinase (ATP-hydrolysing) subunit A